MPGSPPSAGRPGLGRDSERPASTRSSIPLLHKIGHGNALIAVQGAVRQAVERASPHPMDEAAMTDAGSDKRGST
jgi:hypothetical protein